MEVPGNPSKYWLELHQNLYGQKQAGRVWYNYLQDKLLKIRFKKSKHDRCVLYRGKCVYALSTDNTILFGATKQEVENVTRNPRGEKLNLTVEGDVTDFLGMSVKRNKNGIHLSQPLLTSRIIELLWLKDEKV